MRNTQGRRKNTEKHTKPENSKLKTKKNTISKQEILNTNMPGTKRKLNRKTEVDKKMARYERMQKNFKIRQKQKNIEE